jgi:hypothetical protein
MTMGFSKARESNLHHEKKGEGSADRSDPSGRLPGDGVPALAPAGLDPGARGARGTGTRQVGSGA